MPTNDYWTSSQQEDEEIHSKFNCDTDARLLQELWRRKSLHGANSNLEPRLGRQLQSLPLSPLSQAARSFQKTYHIAIKFDNPEDIKMSIVGSGSKTRLDSGEDLLFEIEFRPTLSFKKESEDRRYEICLNVVNANAKFFIPVLVLSPNPIINFPKEITLPATAVNWPAYSNIYVLNYSNHAQKFSFECRSEIKIIPDCKTIGMKPSDGATFLIEFIPKSVGLFREKIHVCTADGEKKFAIVIKCYVIPINIFLSKPKLRNGDFVRWQFSF